MKGSETRFNANHPMRQLSAAPARQLWLLTAMTLKFGSLSVYSNQTSPRPAMKPCQLPKIHLVRCCLIASRTFASNTRSYRRRNSFRFATLYLPFTRSGKCTISATALRSFRSTAALSFSKKAIALGASFRRLSAVSLPHADSGVVALCPTPFTTIADKAKTAAIRAEFILRILQRNLRPNRDDWREQAWLLKNSFLRNSQK